MSSEKMPMIFRENVDLDDPSDVERAVGAAESEEKRQALLSAARALPVGRATLRVALEPVLVRKGEKHPQSGVEIEEDAVALRQNVMFSWATEQFPWCPTGSDTRKELGVMVPYFQAMLGASLLEHAVTVLEGRVMPGVPDPLETWKGALRKLSDTTLQVLMPVTEDVLRWLGDKSGAWAEAEALLGKEGVS